MTSRINAAWCGALLALLTLAGLSPGAAQAQCDSQRVTRLATRYAPVLHFAPTERYFPTVPFWSAVDGIDNNDDGLLDLADSLETFPRIVGDGLPSPLTMWYDSLIARKEQSRSMRLDSARALQATFPAWERMKPDSFLEGVVHDRQWRRISAELRTALAKDTSRLAARESLLNTAKTSEKMLPDILDSLLATIPYTTPPGAELNLIQAEMSIVFLYPLERMTKRYETMRPAWRRRLLDYLMVAAPAADSVAFAAQVDAALDGLSRAIATAALRATTQEEVTQLGRRITEQNDSLQRLVTARAGQARDSIRRLIDDDLLTLRPLQNPPAAAAFFSARCLDSAETQRLWTTLHSDLQSWNRLGLARAFEKWNEEAPSQPAHTFVLLEYYYFYLQDLGLTGHPQDLEKFFVLHPIQSGLEGRLAISIGWAHAPTTPNNVHVRFSRHASPRDSDELHALVELGGHAMAPDRVPYGDFQRGWDVNWQAGPFVWGIRDFQALNGTNYAGDYRDEMALSHDPEQAVVLKPAAAGSPIQSGQYALIRVEDVRDLFEEIATALASADTSLARRQGLSARIDTVLGIPVGRADSSGQARDSSSVLSVAALRALEDWRCRPEWHLCPWKDFAYLAMPTAGLKGFLYAPLPTASQSRRSPRSTGPRMPMGAGPGRSLGGASAPGVMFSTLQPSFRVTTATDIEMGFAFPGTMNFEVGTSLRLGRPIRVGLVYDRYHFYWAGWYANLGVQQPEHGNLAIYSGIGLTVQPLDPAYSRLAPQARPTWANLLLRGFRMKAGVSILRGRARMEVGGQVRFPTSYYRGPDPSRAGGN